MTKCVLDEDSVRYRFSLRNMSHISRRTERNILLGLDTANSRRELYILNKLWIGYTIVQRNKSRDRRKTDRLYVMYDWLSCVKHLNL